MKDQKQVIVTNERQFQKDCIKYDEFLKMAYESITYIEDNTKVVLSIEELIKKDAFRDFAKKFAMLHEDANTLKLSSLRLMDLMDLPVEKLVGIFDRIKLFQFQSSPNLDDYKIWATTPQELERLKVSLDFLAILKKLDTNLTFSNPYKAPIKFNVYDRSSLEPNIHWIKQTGIR
jgi:hypothetical protein